jgi:hypothetical protein
MPAAMFFPSQPTLRIAGRKTFTGAANLGAVGVNELFTTTGAVVLEGFWIRCTSDLVDAVDGALFTLGVTGGATIFGDFTGVFDLDTVDAGDGLDSGITPGVATDGWSMLFTSASGVTAGLPAILDNIIMTISAQAITGGVLEFYVLYRPLSSNGALALGAGMVAI